nr:synapse differentiation-inducing gene protein 1-like isoform X3 [Macaca fascicularis]
MLQEAQGPPIALGCAGGGERRAGKEGSAPGSGYAGSSCAPLASPPPLGSPTSRPAPPRSRVRSAWWADSGAWKGARSTEATGRRRRRREAGRRGTLLAALPSRRGAASGRAEGCAAAAAGPGQDAGLPGPRGEGRAAAAGGGRELSAVLKRRRLRDAGPGAGEPSWEFHRDRKAGEPSFTGPCRAPEPRGGGGTVRGGTDWKFCEDKACICSLSLLLIFLTVVPQASGTVPGI